MAVMFKARYSTLYSLLFVSIVCQSFAATRSYLQIAESDNPREGLKKSIYAFHNVKSYRVRMERKYGASKSEIVTTAEFVSPDRTRSFNKDLEIIYIGKDAYIKWGNEPWKKYFYKTSESTTRARALEEEEIKAIDTGDVEFVGRDMIEGVPTLVYNRIIYSGPNKTKPGVIKYWIGAADGLKRRKQVECCSDSGNVTMVQTYYDYNADIKIEPPKEYDAVNEPIQDGIAVVTAVPDSRIEVTNAPDTRGGLGTGSGGGIGSGDGRGFKTGGGGPSLGGGSNPNVPVKDVDQRPIALNNPQPRYTEEARKNKVEGIVLARALIGSDGLVKKVAIIRGLPDGLDEQAIEAVYQLKFKPAMKGGQPVPFLQTVQIEFNLDKNIVR
jgi:TonB family protein